MASLAKEYTKEKLTGQIFMPFFIVDKILDDVGYTSADILGKKIIDPACGDGRFLIKIVERIIKYSPAEKLVENLQNVYGWDIDEIAIKKAIFNLNNLLKPLNISVNWNIETANSLHRAMKHRNLFSIKEFDQKFDFIVEIHRI